ncbi:hypothetical protein AB9P05_03355 [Roseivirga sp. BDSF3-8]|uniref:hypothetical protein n=1 Tax=Roseivirga sp. BDSF3-8 TaxID=3241598 RepID=UPI00353253FE
MEVKTDYKRELSDIRRMMAKSSRFISLSGLSGIFAGIYALAGAFIAYKIGYRNFDLTFYDRLFERSSADTVYLLLDGLGILTLTLITGFFFTKRKAKKDGIKMWSPASRLLLENLSYPLIAGGLICLILLEKGLVGLVAPLSLVFYGIALVSCSAYTLRDIKFLGVCEIILGIIATFFIGYGLIFWAIGFGVLHIIYGTLMYYKYER